MSDLTGEPELVGDDHHGPALEGELLDQAEDVAHELGVQFGSWAFTRRARESGLVPSMGSNRRLLRQRRHRVSMTRED